MTRPAQNEIELFFEGTPTTTIQPKQPVTIGFKRLTEDAVLPTKAHASDSGYDLVASEDIIVEPGETVIVKTGIAVQLPPGYEATVRPRSGVTAKTKLRVQLGTIDNGYGGEIGVIVDNMAFNALPLKAKKVKTILNEIIPSEDGALRRFDSYIIRKGDRIGQLVITRLPEVTAVEITELTDTTRGDKGFGSSGVSV